MKKKRKDTDIILPKPEYPDPLDDVKDKKVDRNKKLEIPDPLDDVKNKR